MWRAEAEALSEAALIRAAQKNDHDAFEQLVRLHDRSVLRVALNLLRSEEDARDAYQEVFLRTYRSLGGFRFQCSFRTWLYRIATNVCLDQLRRKGVRKEQPLGAKLGANGDGPAFDPIERTADQRAESDPDRVYATEELSRGIADALDRLTSKERVVFEMRHYEGLRLRAIGEAAATVGLVSGSSRGPAPARDRRGARDERRSGQTLPVPGDAQDAHRTQGCSTMTCHQWQSRISLYLYGELKAEENDALEDHLGQCGDCTRVLEDERSFFARLDERKPVEAPPSLLAECRHDLMRNVYRSEPHRAGVRSWWDAFQRSLAGARLVRQPTAALAVAALAFYAGHATQSAPGETRTWFSSPPAQEASLIPADTSLTGIESVAIDPREGNVRIVVEEISRRTISGSPQDPHIRGLLLSAVRTAPNSGVRLDRLDVLTHRTEDLDVRRMLIDSMIEDSNAGVRFKAFDALKAHKQDPEVRRALVEVLRRDGNPGMRVQAIELLTEAPDRDLVGVLQELVETEANQYVRLRSEQTLQELNASVDRF